MHDPMNVKFDNILFQFSRIILKSHLDSYGFYVHICTIKIFCLK